MKTLLLLIVFFVCSPSYALDAWGVNVPDEVTVEGKKLVLNGAGLRKKLVFKVYVGALYLESKSSDVDAIVNSTQPKKLDLHFVRSVGKDKMRDAWKDGFKKNSIENYNYSSDLSVLNRAMKNTRKGDIFSFTFLSDKTIVKVADGDPFEIAGPNFGKVMLRVFINKPPNPELKKGLLGK